MVRQASLPMYDFREVRAATDAWWTGIAKHMRCAGVKDVPAQLQYDVPVKSLWQHDDLLLTQCCGFDVACGFKDSLSVLMITDWVAEGCYDGYYCSWVVVHEDSQHQHLSDLFNGIAVINSRESHSGMNALLALAQPYSIDGFFFRCIKESGAHVDSLATIQQQAADIAAIDCVTYALLKAYRPAALSGIRIIGKTAVAPAHPYVTRNSVPVDTQYRMQDALSAAFNDSSLNSARDTMLLKKGIFGRSNDYHKILDDFRYDTRLLNAAG